MKKVIAIALALSSTMAAGEIYKWVDENGVTHYGSKKPPSVAAETVNIRTGAVTKVADADVQEFAESAKRELMKDHGSSAKLDCNKAVANSREQLNDMMSNLEKNFRGGYVSDADFQTAKEQLATSMRKISTGDCSSSSGENKNFYLCMSNSKNSIMMCGAKHNFQ